MDVDAGLLIGLIAIAIAIFLGLREFRRTIGDRLSDIERHTEPVVDIKNSIASVDRAIVAIQGTVEKVWDVVSRTAYGETGTIERNLERLGKTRITAAPGADETVYEVQIEKPILKEASYFKIGGRGTELASKEQEILGHETVTRIYAPSRLKITLPSTDAETCTRFMNYFLVWLDTTYATSLKEIGDFEDHILV